MDMNYTPKYILIVLPIVLSHYCMLNIEPNVDMQLPTGGIHGWGTTFGCLTV